MPRRPRERAAAWRARIAARAEELDRAALAEVVYHGDRSGAAACWGVGSSAMTKRLRRHAQRLGLAIDATPLELARAQGWVALPPGLVHDAITLKPSTAVVGVEARIAAVLHRWSCDWPNEPHVPGFPWTETPLCFVRAAAVIRQGLT